MSQAKWLGHLPGKMLNLFAESAVKSPIDRSERRRELREKREEREERGEKGEEREEKRRVRSLELRSFCHLCQTR
jgi:hypothetical protein